MVRFVDDIVLFAKSKKGLQTTLTETINKFLTFKLNMNTVKQK